MLRLPIDHISQIGGFCFCYQNRFFRNLQITIRAQISLLNQKPDKIRSRKCRIHDQRILRITSVQLNCYFHVINVLIPVLLQCKPQLVCPISCAPLPVSYDSRNHILRMRTVLVPLNHSLYKIILGKILI